MRNVIFDLGGVVFRWNPTDIVQGFYSDPALRASILHEVFQHPDWVELDRGTLLESDAIQRFHLRTGRPVAELAALMDAARESLLPIPETVELLHELSARDVPLYCLSNAPTSTIDYLQARHTLWKVFSGIVISGAIQLAKPDPAIFHYIANRYALTPHETVFVDDLAPNVDSANRLGFKTLLFREPAQCREELLALLNLT